MFKLVLEKAEEPEIKLPTSAESWKKQESSRKTYISAFLTMPKPLTVFSSVYLLSSGRLFVAPWSASCQASQSITNSQSLYKLMSIRCPLELDVFLELSCFFHDSADVGNLISGSSAFSKTSLNIWNFMVHILAWRILSITLLACEMTATVQ